MGGMGRACTADARTACKLQLPAAAALHARREPPPPCALASSLPCSYMYRITDSIVACERAVSVECMARKGVGACITDMLLEVSGGGAWGGGWVRGALPC